MRYTQPEQAVLRWMAEHASVPSLRAQIEPAIPTKREYTGKGSYTKLKVPGETREVRCHGPILGPVFESDALEFGGSALLWLDDTGHLDQLELCAFGDFFPESTIIRNLRECAETEHQSPADR
jgi:hypothetical protein